MGDGTGIEWTDATWNPVVGCTKVSAGCRNCYADELHGKRHRAVLAGKRLPAQYARPFTEVQTFPVRLDEPRRWRRPRHVFVCSTSDLFHEDVPFDFLREVFAVMASCPRHTFQVLTKRSRRLADLAHALPWPENVWVGVSVETVDHYDRIRDLETVPAVVRFLSLEPLLGPLEELPLGGVSWVITGGESGPRSRPVEAAWVRSIRDQTKAAGAAFFFKQWGGTNKRKAGKVLEGRTWAEMPEIAERLTRHEMEAFPEGRR